MSKGRILLVEDDPSVNTLVAAFLRAHDYEVDTADSLGAAEGALRARPPDAVLLDQVLPDGNGLELLARLKAAPPAVPVIMLTGHGSIELAVRAIKEGAEQFLTKPVDMTALLVLLERLVENERRKRQQLASHSRADRQSIDPFEGRSPAMAALAEEAKAIAAAESPVLIQGETGTGKGVLARWLHENGPRADGAFVDLNCAGLARELLESELFGHEAGAFTGALKTKLGLVEVAHQGTLFLDEIGDMETAVQPKLLKVIEEGGFRRLGAVRDRHVDLRLIAATHQDLAERVQARSFRSDLFFRINTLTIVVPSLRERSADIPLLAESIAQRVAREMGRGPVALSPAALAALQRYAWPGNVRELRNVLERAVLLCGREVIEPADLRFAFAPPAESVAEQDAPVTLADLERRHIETMLRAHDGSVDRTARALGISKSSLYDRIKRFGIAPSDS
jgi:DNA-binding NtrC family response regulator